MSTKTDLVVELMKFSSSDVRDYIIDRAQRGIYHDFETPLATPKMELVKDLKDGGFNDLANRVKNGEFDEDP